METERPALDWIRTGKREEKTPGKGIFLEKKNQLGNVVFKDSCESLEQQCVPGRQIEFTIMGQLLLLSYI